MERIGLAASKIAKGNLLYYNATVVVISFLFSLLIFVISGFSIFLALFLIGTLIMGATAMDFKSEWMPVLRICFITLSVVVGIFNLAAILKNIRIRKQ